MSRVQILVAVLVAVLGIINTLTVSITDRRRELGVLQAVGGLRRQVRRTIWLEALSIGAIGLILGIALGVLNIYYTLGMVRRDLGGLDLDYHVPNTDGFGPCSRYSRCRVRCGDRAGRSRSQGFARGGAGV